MTVSEQLRQQVLERDNNTCQTCLRRDKRLDIHHIIPKRLGGLDILNNIFSTCCKCHKLIELRSPIVKKRTTIYSNDNGRKDIVFVAKVSRLKEDKYLVIVPKQYNSRVEKLHKKQVRIVLQDEL